MIRQLVLPYFYNHNKMGMEKNLMVGLGGIFTLILLGIILVVGNNTLETVKVSGETTQIVLETNESAVGNATLTYGGENAINNASLTASNTTGLLTKHTDYDVTTGGVITLHAAGSTAGSGTYNYSYNHTKTIHDLQYNATEQGQSGLDNFSDFQTTLAVVIVLVVIVAFLVGVLMATRS